MSMLHRRIEYVVKIFKLLTQTIFQLIQNNLKNILVSIKLNL